MLKKSFATVVAMAAVVGFGAPGQAQEFQFRLGTVVSEPHPWISMAEYFAETVRERTDGAVEVTVVPGGALGNDATMIDEMRIGTLDFIIGAAQNTVSFVPEYGLFSAAYLWRDMDSFEAAIDPEGELFQRFEEIYENRRLGLKLLAFSGGGTRNLSNTLRPITEPGQLQGVKMRVPGSPIDAKLWASYGAAPTSVPWPELYTAIQTGVADAFESTISGYTGSKLHEVAPYHSKTEHQIMLTHFTMAEASFNRLPPEYQDIIVETAREAAVLGTAKGVEFDETLLDELQEQHGVTVTEVDKEAFMAIAAPLQEEVAEEIGVTDILALVRAAQE